MELGGGEGIKGLTGTLFLPAVFTVFPFGLLKGATIASCLPFILGSSEEKLVKIKGEVLFFIAREWGLNHSLYVSPALHQHPTAFPWASQGPTSQVMTLLPSQKLFI